MIKIISLILTSVIIICALCGCNSNNLESSKEDAAVVLNAGEFEIKYELYRYFYENHMEDSLRKTVNSSDSKDLADKSARQSIKQVYAVFSLAKEHGIDLESDVVSEMIDSKMEEIRGGYENEKAYIEDISKNHMTDSVYRLLTAYTLISDELYVKLIDDNIIPSKSEYWKDFFRSEDYIRVKQIFVDITKHSEKEADLKIKEAKSKLENGVEFDSVVKEYGEDLFMFNNTDGYYICKGMWSEEFEKAAFELSVGEQSDIVSSDSGYSIFLKCEKETGFIEKNFESLVSDCQKARFLLMLNDAEDNLEITENENFEKIVKDKAEK